MDFAEALDLVVATTKHERYRFLTSEECPDHEHYRALILEMATGVPRSKPEEPPDPVKYPPLTTQLKNVMAAAARHAKNGFRKVGKKELARRLAICRSNECGIYDAEQDRCISCGCFANLKARAESEHCPVGKW